MESISLPQLLVLIGLAIMVIAALALVWLELVHKPFKD